MAGALDLLLAHLSPGLQEASSQHGWVPHLLKGPTKSHRVILLVMAVTKPVHIKAKGHRPYILTCEGHIVKDHMGLHASFLWLLTDNHKLSG